MWAKDPIQYSPLGDIEYKGKKYQKMTGLYVNRTHLSCEFTYDNVPDFCQHYVKKPMKKKTY